MQQDSDSVCTALRAALPGIWHEWWIFPIAGPRYLTIDRSVVGRHQQRAKTHDAYTTSGDAIVLTAISKERLLPTRRAVLDVRTGESHLDELPLGLSSLGNAADEAPSSALSP